jgi:hypothetical protein
MIRLTRKVFTDLAIWMTGLGLIMGLVFPFFVVMMGVPTEYVLTPLFFAATMTAASLSVEPISGWHVMSSAASCTFWLIA